MIMGVQPKNSAHLGLIWMFGLLFCALLVHAKTHVSADPQVVCHFCDVALVCGDFFLSLLNGNHSSILWDTNKKYITLYKKSVTIFSLKIQFYCDTLYIRHINQKLRLSDWNLTATKQFFGQKHIQQIIIVCTKKIVTHFGKNVRNII